MLGNTGALLTRRRLLGSIGVVAAASLITACSQPAAPVPTAAPSQSATLPPTSGQPTAAATQPTASTALVAAASAPSTAAGKLRFITWGDINETNLRAKYVNEFVQKNPQIQVQYTPTPQNYWDALQTQMAGGDAPDLYYLEPAHVVDLQCRGALLEIDSYVSRDKYDLSDFYKDGITEYTIAGKLWALPRDFANQDVFYNKDLFEKAGIALPPKDFNASGWTFDDFLQACQKLTQGSGPSKQFGFAVPTGFRAYMAFVWSNGGDVVSDDLKTCTLNQPNAVEALQFLDDLVGKYHVAPRPADMAQQTADTLFFTGRVAMTISIPANLGTYRKQIKSFHFDVAPPPMGPHGKARRVGGGGAGYGIYGKTKAPDAAWELMKWVTSEDVQKQEVDGGTSMGSRLSVGDYFVKVNQGKDPSNVGMFVQASKSYLHTDPHANGWLQAQNVLSKDLSG